MDAVARMEMAIGIKEAGRVEFLTEKIPFSLIFFKKTIFEIAFTSGSFQYLSSWWTWYRFWNIVVPFGMVYPPASMSARA